jgi:uncharacterized membrane protein YgaE (UPF0421/DUF939 family)
MSTFPGLRILKTALAVAICVAISQALKLEYPFYAAIAAIISLESSLTTSFKAGRNRMLGTFVGALVGLGFASIAPDNALLCGVGIVIIIVILNAFHWNSSITIAGIVFIAIMVNLDGRSPLLYSANRLLDTALGISVALAVNYLVFPRRIDQEFRQRYAALQTQTRALVQGILVEERRLDPLELEEKIAELKAQIALHAHDLKLRPRHPLALEPITADLERFKQICTHLAVLSELEPGGELSAENAARLQACFPGAALSAGPAEHAANEVFNYHVSRVLDLLPDSTV